VPNACLVSSAHLKYLSLHQNEIKCLCVLLCAE
jgi:hypothetical protein